MRRVPALLLLAALAVPPAAAHVSPRLRIASPADGSTVYGDTVKVTVVGEGGDGAGLFTLALDGTLVDATGKVGGTFTTLGVQPNAQTTVEVPVSPGEHELVLAQAPDPDNEGGAQRPVVVRFTARAEQGGGAGLMLVLAAVVGAGTVGAVVAVRRRAAGDAPAAGPDADH